MFFDMQESTMVMGMLAFPDHPYANLERAQVREEVIVGGTASGGRVLEVTGTADQQE